MMLHFFCSVDENYVDAAYLDHMLLLLMMMIMVTTTTIKFMITTYEHFWFGLGWGCVVIKVCFNS